MQCIACSRSGEQAPSQTHAGLPADGAHASFHACTSLPAGNSKLSRHCTWQLQCMPQHAPDTACRGMAGRAHKATEQERCPLMLRARAAACAARTTQSTHPHRTRRHALPELCRQAADSACMHQACSSSFRCCASSLCPRSCCIEANLRRTAYIKHLQQPALLLLLLLPQRSGSACMTHSLLPYPANATGHYS